MKQPDIFLVDTNSWQRVCVGGGGMRVANLYTKFIDLLYLKNVQMK